MGIPIGFLVAPVTDAGGATQDSRQVRVRVLATKSRGRRSMRREDPDTTWYPNSPSNLATARDAHGACTAT
eukprot:3587003-Pyramimonas_sp.AAC.1